MNNDFAVFIISYSRPNKQHTLKSLLDRSYIGQWYIVLDDTDPTIQEYIDNFGAENIIVFDKNHYINTVDTAMLVPYYSAALYARSAVEDIAHDLGYKAFILLDDDITDFSIRYPDNDKLRRLSKFDINLVFNSIVEFMFESDATMVGATHPGMFFSGIKMFEPSTISSLINTSLPYNVMFRNVKHPMNWVSAYGEDDITANNNTTVGNKILTVPFLQFTVVPNKSKAKGGMYRTYNDNDSFDLMFRIYMQSPTSVNIVYKQDGFGTRRLRNNMCPRILSKEFVKEN